MCERRDASMKEHRKGLVIWAVVVLLLLFQALAPALRRFGLTPENPQQ